MPITISTVIAAPLKAVWESWTTPEHIMKWNHASSDWYCPRATNDLIIGGKFRYTMSSINGIHSFDSTGTYTEIIPQEKISYIIPEDIYTDETGKTHQAAERKVTIMFKKSSLGVIVTEVFDAEELNSQKQQQSGWQAILENFREYVESQPSDSIRTS